MNQFADRLVLDLDTAAGQRFRGSVSDASVEGHDAKIVAEFPFQNAPVLQIGEGVSLWFPGLGGAEPFHTPAQVITRIEDRLRLRYRFEVGRPVGTVLAPLADWRFATRVQPYPQAPVHATLERLDKGPGYPAEVKDISATGIGLRVAPQHEKELFANWKLKVKIVLPGSPVEFEMIGNVCYRRPDGKMIFYGLDFDTAATLDFSGKQEVVHQYVTHCQSAAITLLRQALEVRQAG